MPLGTATTIRGRDQKLRRCTRPTKYRSIRSALSKSAMTPSRSGRTVAMCSGVRPSIALASFPAPIRAPVAVATATMDGSASTIP